MSTNTASKVTADQPAIGEALGGGFFAGQIRIDGQLFALIVAPKQEGEHGESPWHNRYGETVEGAQAWDDGLSNTRALAAAGSPLAKWATDLRIGGNDDWYLPSQDELEVLYRNLKPTAEENWCYARSGINLSAAEPTRPYTPAVPAQTNVEVFRIDGDQAFAAAWYWSSTQHASDANCAWCQYFGYGRQGSNRTDVKLRARAVRRIAI